MIEAVNAAVARYSIIASADDVSLTKEPLRWMAPLGYGGRKSWNRRGAGLGVQSRGLAAVTSENLAGRHLMGFPDSAAERLPIRETGSTPIYRAQRQVIMVRGSYV